jgi:hypothetical protein
MDSRKLVGWPLRLFAAHLNGQLFKAHPAFGNNRNDIIGRTRSQRNQQRFRRLDPNIVGCRKHNSMSAAIDAKKTLFRNPCQVNLRHAGSLLGRDVPPGVWKQGGRDVPPGRLSVLK